MDRFSGRSGIRFCDQNRDPVAKRKSMTDFSGTVFDRDRDRDCRFKIADRFANEIR
jgi:hypothetical protein